MNSAPKALLRWVAGATVVFALLASCAEPSRHRVMTFLFDGVPEEGRAPAVEPDQPGVPEVLEGLTPAVEKRPLPPAIVSVHEPYQKRQCKECHDSPLQLEKMPHNADLCDRCHLDQRVAERWDHGPINLGTCVPCHVPHSSKYPHLLSEKVPEVCLHCHEAGEPTPEHHVAPNYEQCTECHDPHRMY